MNDLESSVPDFVADRKTLTSTMIYPIYSRAEPARNYQAARGGQQGVIVTPPEPQSGQHRGQIRHNEAFTRCSGIGVVSGTLELGRKSYETHNKTHNTRPRTAVAIVMLERGARDIRSERCDNFA